ncbi:hypothetical protein GQ53DRAFT_822602 [Thozetella sp. PMI_491]|nr:hypothetical protein GQ53DRAFT_822602 [Thozetella sp. PMI_491]
MFGKHSQAQLAKVVIYHLSTIIDKALHRAEAISQISTYLSLLAAVITALDIANKDDLYAIRDHLGSLVKYYATTSINYSQFSLNQYLALLNTTKAYTQNHKDNKKDKPIIPI